MRVFAKLVVPVLLLSGVAMGDSWNGTLIDVMCKDRDPAAHTRDCAVKCSESGYGLVLSDGTFLKFDADGNTKALEVLKSADKEKDLTAEVTGTAEDGAIKVESIKLVE